MTAKKKYKQRMETINKTVIFSPCEETIFVKLLKAKGLDDSFMSLLSLQLTRVVL